MLASTVGVREQKVQTEAQPPRQLSGRPSKPLQVAVMEHTLADNDAVVIEHFPKVHANIRTQPFEVDACYELVQSETPRHSSLFMGVGAVARETSTGTRVCVAKVSLPTVLSDDGRRLIKELLILRHFNHEHVQPLLDVMLPPTNRMDDLQDLYIVTPFNTHSLDEVRRQAASNLSITHIQYFTAQLMTALNALHTSGVVHGDLRSSCVMVQPETLHLTLGGFHKASVIVGRNSSPQSLPLFASLTMVTKENTMNLAPEALLGGSMGFPLDMWAAGCVLAELLGGRDSHPLFMANAIPQQLQLIVNALGQPSPSDLERITIGAPSAAREHVTALQQESEARRLGDLLSRLPSTDKQASSLVEALLVFDPFKRLSAAAALKHAFVDEPEAPQEDAETPFDAEAHRIAEDCDSAMQLVTELIRHFHPKVNLIPPSAAPEEHAGVMAELSSPELRRFCRPDSIWQLLRAGHVALIRSSWWLQRAEENVPLARRQELPPEAFWDSSKLHKMHLASRAKLLPIVVLSHICAQLSLLSASQLIALASCLSLCSDASF